MLIFYRNSERLIDEQINIAMETRDNLVFQRETIKVTFKIALYTSSKGRSLNSFRFFLSGEGIFLGPIYDIDIT